MLNIILIFKSNIMGTPLPYTEEFVVQLYLSKLHEFAFALAKDAFEGKIFYTHIITCMQTEYIYLQSSLYSHLSWYNPFKYPYLKDRHQVLQSRVQRVLNPYFPNSEILGYIYNSRFHPSHIHQLVSGNVFKPKL